MFAAQLFTPSSIEGKPLKVVELPVPNCEDDKVLIKVLACGVCHTDLHIAEGDLQAPNYPIILGHQIAGKIVSIGHKVTNFKIGDYVGIPWLHRTCGNCYACKTGNENLCSYTQFTGFHVNGGFAEFILADTQQILHLPAIFEPAQASPLLCAGIIGFRSLKLAEINTGENIGLVGFGASAHLAIQIANYWNCKTYVFTRSMQHRQHAIELGAVWAGGLEQNIPINMDRMVIFAPNGKLVPAALEKLRPGGTLAINAIYMSTIPEIEYPLLYGERTIRSVTNATRQDGVDFLNLAAKIPIFSTVQKYALDEINNALFDLKHSQLKGEGVIVFP